MDIFVYSDESGVFDVVHNDYFVFGGLIFLGKTAKDNCAHKYAHVEKVLRSNKLVDASFELKATKLCNSEKSQLFRCKFRSDGKHFPLTAVNSFHTER